MQQNYVKRINEANKKLYIYLNRSSKLSKLRLVTFIAFLFSFLIYLMKSNYLFLLIAVLFLGVFIYLIVIHNKVSKSINYYQLLIETLNEYICRFDKRWIDFSESGLDYKNDHMSYLEDLDIIGDVSLFKYLNVCITKNGKEKLIERLSNPFNTKDDLQIKQNSMIEISKNIDFSLNFQVALKNYRNEGASINLKYITKNLQSKIDFSKIFLYVTILFTASILCTLILAALNKISWLYFSLVFLSQFIFSTICRAKYKDVFGYLGKTFLTLVMLDEIYEVIKNENFEDDILIKLQRDIVQYGTLGIKKISKVKDIESYNNFFLTNFIFNGLFSINVLIINAFKQFIGGYGVHFYKSVEALEEFEVYTSLAVLGQTKENICKPNLSDDIAINFSDLKHPLIPENECVENSFSQVTNVNIITGSNMSGKTSFLRTIGINLILMNAGAYCNASSLSAPYLKVYTSMRIADDISKGISTFYAELLRVKMAIEYAKKGKPMIVFIDEIFKGTNSNDRIKGAISLIEKLNQKNILIFISTHDFELCEIQSVKISNYHFSEYYEEDKIMFDYKLKQGKCNTTNARYLMKLAGIIDK